MKQAAAASVVALTSADGALNPPPASSDLTTKKYGVPAVSCPSLKLVPVIRLAFAFAKGPPDVPARNTSKPATSGGAVQDNVIDDGPTASIFTPVGRGTVEVPVVVISSGFDAAPSAPAESTAFPTYLYVVPGERPSSVKDVTATGLPVALAPSR